MLYSVILIIVNKYINLLGRPFLYTSAFLLVLVGLFVWVWISLTTNASAPVTMEVSDDSDRQHSFSQTEEVFDPLAVSAPVSAAVGINGRYTVAELLAWQRPPGPVRVGVQVGHLNNTVTDLPSELQGLAQNGAGAVWGPYNERDTVAVIVEYVAEQLRAEGVEVDVLPVVIPPGYQADAFISVHADGNANESVNGFKIAGPRRDVSGYADSLVSALYDSYESVTGLRIDPVITSRMDAYNAFSWHRYEHAIHPLTPAAIVETGFLTNTRDRNFLLENPEQTALGISEGVLRFLETTDLSTRTPEWLTEVPGMPIEGEVVCAPVRPGARVPANGDACGVSILTESGDYYVLVGESTDAYQALLGNSVAVTGTFQPLAARNDFFWYRYLVAGEVVVADISTIN